MGGCIELYSLIENSVEHEVVVMGERGGLEDEI